MGLTVLNSVTLPDQYATDDHSHFEFCGILTWNKRKWEFLLNINFDSFPFSIFAPFLVTWHVIAVYGTWQHHKRCCKFTEGSGVMLRIFAFCCVFIREWEYGIITGWAVTEGRTLNPDVNLKLQNIVLSPAHYSLRNTALLVAFSPNWTQSWSN